MSIANLDHIPNELTSRPQWVGFKVEDGRKTPIIPGGGGRKASSTNPKTWRPFNLAIEGLRDGVFNALAYALNGDFIGVDLDKCFDAGALSPYAAEIVQRCSSYTERSFSGSGVHILLTGTWPGGRGRNVRGVEVYNRGRFFICTGNLLRDTPATIQANPEAVSWLLRDVTEKAEPTEPTEAISASSPSLSAVSVTLSADEVILRTTPKRPGERNVRLFEMARGLRFNAGLADRPMRELKPFVHQWHAAALPVIRTKDFTETWADFCHAWPRARVPLGADVLREAWTRSLTDPPPAAASEYADSEPVRRLVGFCAALARPSPDSGFFLSTRAAAELLGVKPMQVCRWFKMLEADSIIEVLHVGNEHRATRFRWLGTYAP